MLLLLSPSKTQESGYGHALATGPEMLGKAEALAARLKQLDAADIARVMQVSRKLAEQTFQRYSQFRIAAERHVGSPALLAFRGDVFSEIGADRYSDEDFRFAQQHLRIFSGLYGILRPLDLIQPYRLEMGGAFRPEEDISLYDYWRADVTAALKRHLDETRFSEVLNLASNEYFKVLKTTGLPAAIVQVLFKQQREGSLRTIAVHAKRARGALADYIIRNRLQNSDRIRDFSYKGYRFAEESSTANELFFIDKGQENH